MKLKAGCLRGYRGIDIPLSQWRKKERERGKKCKPTDSEITKQHHNGYHRSKKESLGIIPARCSQALFRIHTLSVTIFTLIAPFYLDTLYQKLYSKKDC